MHFRLSLWMGVLMLALSAVHGQTPSIPASAKPQNSLPEGQILALKVSGTVSQVLNGTTSDVHNGDRVRQSATIVTGKESSVILVFSNGATIQLGNDTTLVIERYLQDPFAEAVKISELEAEPTTSRTRLKLTKGEIIGKVKHLNHSKGSTFTIQTPVGAAGIRGTTFRIVFRPSGTGQAFAVFSISTVEGNVVFKPGSVVTGDDADDAALGDGVAVAGGQEVAVTVSVDIDPITGIVTISRAPVITSTQPITVETQTLIIQQALGLVGATTDTIFGAASNGTSRTESTSGSPSPPPTTPLPAVTPGAGR